MFHGFWRPVRGPIIWTGYQFGRMVLEGGGIISNVPWDRVTTPSTSHRSIIPFFRISYQWAVTVDQMGSEGVIISSALRIELLRRWLTIDLSSFVWYFTRSLQIWLVIANLDQLPFIHHGYVWRSFIDSKLFGHSKPFFEPSKNPPFVMIMSVRWTFSQ
jgi:hypothetical protein